MERVLGGSDDMSASVTDFFDECSIGSLDQVTGCEMLNVGVSPLLMERTDEEFMLEAF